MELAPTKRGLSRFVVDWNAIKTEYITTDTSYRKLAEKFGVNYTTIGNRARAENWLGMRERHRSKTLSKTLSSIADKQARKMARIDSITDRLLDKLEKAVDELDLSIVVLKVKTDSGSQETTTEKRIALPGGIVDRAGLRQITAALRDIKEVQMLKTELDRREQEARIANLERQTEADGAGRSVEVVFTGDTGEYSE